MSPVPHGTGNGCDALRAKKAQHQNWRIGKLIRPRLTNRSLPTIGKQLSIRARL